MGVSPVGVNGYTDRPDNMPVASQVARLNACVSVETSVETITSHNVDDRCARAPLRVLRLDHERPA